MTTLQEQFAEAIINAREAVPGSDEQAKWESKRRELLDLRQREAAAADPEMQRARANTLRKNV
jgi:hypothetical protein